MKTKLTLTIKKEVIETATAYAKKSEQSLSEIVEIYLKLITANRKQLNPKQLSPRTKSLRGIIKSNEKLNQKQILTEERLKKYSN